MLNLPPFEIITIDGARFRCEKPSHFWQYGLVSGTIDVEDKTIVEVYSINKDEEETLIKTFTQVIAVGCVTDETLLIMPAEKRKTRCDRCGFIAVT